MNTAKWLSTGEAAPAWHSPGIQVIGSAQCPTLLLSPQLLLLPPQLLTLTHNALLLLAPFTLHTHALPLQSLPLQSLPLQPLPLALELYPFPLHSRLLSPFLEGVQPLLPLALLPLPAGR